MPSLELVNRQRKKHLDLVGFRAFAKPAMEKVSEMVRKVPLPEEIIVVFVSDARIAGIHREFMAVDGPTDVITFRHGEILISVDTAERQAKRFSTSFSRELRLYFVHGLLHLAGLDDLTEAGFETMAAAQEEIVASVSEEVASVSGQLSVGPKRSTERSISITKEEGNKCRRVSSSTDY
jgi:probable rRNA maturation factor